MPKLAVIANPIIESLKAIKDVADPYEYVEKVYGVLSKVKTALHMADFEAGNPYDGEMFQIKIIGSIRFHDDLLFNEQHFSQNRTELIIQFRERGSVTDTEFNSINENIIITDVIDHKKMLGIVFNREGKYCKSGVHVRSFDTEETVLYSKLLNEGIIRRFHLKAPLFLHIGYECENVKEYCWQLAGSCDERFIAKAEKAINEKKYPTPPPVYKKKK